MKKEEKVRVSQLSQTSNSENFDPVITFYLELRWHIGHLLLRCSFWLRRTASVPAVRNLELLRPVLASGKAAFPFSIFSFFFDPFSLLDIFWCPVRDVLFFSSFSEISGVFFLIWGQGNCSECWRLMIVVGSRQPRDCSTTISSRCTLEKPPPHPKAPANSYPLCLPVVVLSPP